MADPVSFLASFAISTIISGVISYLFPAQGPRLTDLSVSASTYGNPIPWVWGDVRVGGNMIWSSGIIEHKHKKKAGLGSYYNQYSYSANFAMAFCRGPATALRRIWANGKLIYDSTGTSPNVTNGKFKCIFYNGTEEQMPDPTISTAIGIDNTPPYRGIVYIVFTDFQLGDYGNQLPQIAVEIIAGPVGDTPVTLFNDGDPTVPYSHFYNGSLAVDYTHGYFYTSNEAIDGIVQWDLATGKYIREAVVKLPPEDTWDSGTMSGVYAVNKDGDIIVNMSGASNNIRLGRINPNSLGVSNTISHGAPWELDGLTPPWVAYLTDMYPDTTAENFLGVTHSKSTYFIDGFLNSASGDFNGSAFDGTFGTLNSAFTACGIDIAKWAIAYNGVDMTGSGPGAGIRLRSFTNGLDFDSFNVDIPNPDSTASATPRNLAYDGATNSVLLFYETSNNGWVTKFSLDTKQILWNRALPHGVAWEGFRVSNLVGGTIAWISSTNKLYLMNTSDGMMVNRAPDQFAYADNLWLRILDIALVNPGETGYPLGPGAYQGFQYFDGVNGTLVSLSSKTNSAIVNVGAFGATAVTLAFICTDLLTAAGLTPDQFDVSNLASQTVHGYGFAQTSDIKSLLGELQEIFMFDLFERDGKLVGLMRGGSTSAETISYKVLGNVGGDDNSADYWKETRLSEADIPASVSLKYLNIEQDFEQNTAVSKRIFAPLPTMFSRQQDNVEAAIVFDPTEAKNQVNKMLYVAWAERIRHETKLPLAYAYLEPSDLITVNLADGRSYFERISQTEFGADYSSDVQSLGQDSGAYTQNLTGDGGTGMGQTVDSPEPAQPFIFNTPYLRDIDAVGDGQYSIYYDAVGNMVRDNYHGATLFQSVDGQSYDIIGTFAKDLEYGAVMGGAVPDAACGVYAMDWKTKITIYPAVSWFALESCTDDELSNGANMCIIGDEVMQFRDAIHNADNSWTISNLLRGRRGTEWACSTHKAGETFAFLNTATMGVSQEPLDAGGKTFWYKAVGTGTDVALAKIVKITYAPRDLMPYAPVQLSAAWNVADIQVSFQRRTRYGGNMVDGTGLVPLNETTEAFEMDVYDAGGNVLRTIKVDLGPTPAPNEVPSITYPAAQIAADFPSAINTITVAVYQIGKLGRGFGNKKTLVIHGTASPTSRFWGVSPNATLTEAQVIGLGFQDLNTDFVNSVSYDCAGGNYPYYAYPATFGIPAHVLVNSLPFSDFTVTVETVGGVSYNVIRFNRIQHGTGIPVAWQ